MAWTYNPDDPGAVDKDRVRLLIGDTESSEPLLQDEEIAHFLSVQPNVRNAAADAAGAIAALFAKRADVSIADTRIAFLQRSAEYSKLADRLRSKSVTDAEVYVGGVYVIDKETDEADSSLTQPIFTKGMMDYGSS